MSGGYFQFRQFKIGEIAEDIEQVIINNRSDKKDQYGDRIGHHYKPEVIERLSMAVRILRHAQVYAHRVDWLLSCDDGEDSFLQRLAEDLEALP